MVGMKDGSPTGYHFHNFFMDADEVRNKYATYGHAKSDAKNLPMWEVSEDTQLAVDCAHGRRAKALDFNDTGSSVLPIYYSNRKLGIRGTNCGLISFKRRKNIVAIERNSGCQRSRVGGGIVVKIYVSAG